MTVWCPDSRSVESNCGIPRGGTVNLSRSVAVYAHDEPCAKHSGYRFPPAIISRAVWLYHRFGLSFREL